MDRPTSSVIKGRQIVKPSVGVPGPARDWTINNSRPQEAENQGWNNSAALERAADQDLNSRGAEEKLIEAEYNLGQVRGPRRRSSLDSHHAKVLHRANERTGITSICERVTLRVSISVPMPLVPL